MNTAQNKSARSWVVVDASLILRLLIDELGSAEAQALWESWKKQRAIVAAPTLLVYEVVNGLHQALRHNALTDSELTDALQTFAGFPVRYHEPLGLASRASELARESGLQATYDSFYIALAESLQGEFWTGDQKLHDRLHQRLPRLRSLWADHL